MESWIVFKRGDRNRAMGLQRREEVPSQVEGLGRNWGQRGSRGGTWETVRREQMARAEAGPRAKESVEFVNLK